jgi:hypothetical protein
VNWIEKDLLPDLCLAKAKAAPYGAAFRLSADTPAGDNPVAVLVQSENGILFQKIVKAGPDEGSRLAY